MMREDNSNIIIENKVLQSIDRSCTSVTIPAEVVKIGKRAFKGSEISTVGFEGNNLKSIDDEAFMDCTSLTSIMIPEGVVQIGDRAFYGCSNLEYVGIPESVMVVGDNVFENCSPNLFVIGKPKTEAENIANQYKLTLKSDSDQAISAFLQAKTAREKIETRVFDIFGEEVSCSNTLVKYHSNLKYYSERKDPLFKELTSNLPVKLSGNFGDLAGTLKREENRTIDRLSSQGVFMKEHDLDSYLLEPYKSILNVVMPIKEAYEKVSKGVSDEISSNRETLRQEAESRITGLSYGIIGDGLDMLAYSIDDALERKRQRKEAYALAEKKFSQVKQNAKTKGENIYADFITEALPVLRQGTDKFIEALCKAENDYLMKAGLIDADIESEIDPIKSAQLMSSIVDKTGDNSFTVALALKKYPCNMSAIVYAKEHGYESQGLTDLIIFLELENKLETSMIESKKNRIASITASMKTVPNCRVGIKCIKKEEDVLDEKEKRKLLSTLSTVITPRIENIINDSLDLNVNIQSYCENKLNSIITYDEWSYFLENKVSPIKSSVLPNTDDYSELQAWLCKQLGLRIQETRQRQVATESAAKKRKRIIVIASVLVCLSIVFAIVLKAVIIPITKYNRAVKLKNQGDYLSAIQIFECLDGYKDSFDQITDCKYNNALALMNAGKYEEAFLIFQDLNDYKDSVEQYSKCVFLLQKTALSNISVGSIIKFGEYEQDNDLTNGKEQIEWIVLDIESGKALVISRYALDYQNFNNSNECNTWETCSLRIWLNGLFYEEAFGSDYQQMILYTTVTADSNPSYTSVNQGNDTEDKVFLLSVEEARDYLGAGLLSCPATPYSDTQNHSTGTKTCWWWLRTIGGYNDSGNLDGYFFAVKVTADGTIDCEGDLVVAGGYIRPAMWIDLDA